MNDDRWIGTSAAARMLGTSPATVKRLAESGDLKAFKFTDRGWWQISRRSVELLIERKRREFGALD